MDERLTKLAEQITMLETEEKSVATRLTELRKRKLDVGLEVVRLLYGVEPGTVVMDRNRKQYRVVRVDHVNAAFSLSHPDDMYARPWLKVTMLKKDGTWSVVERTMYSEWFTLTEFDKMLAEHAWREKAKKEKLAL